MLRLHHYKKTYGAEPVLQIENLELPSGVYWLKGENGTGKTTLLKSIAGLIPFDGTIEVEGVSLRKQRRNYTKNVSFAEAEPLYPSFLTGKELLNFYLQTKGGNEANAKEMSEAFGVSNYLSTQVGTYSSGMMKKLSLLLAFVGEPHLILLDEPFITLDVKAVQTLRTTIATTARKGVSFLLSSHQEPELDEPCKTLHIHGRTIQPKSHVAGA